MIFGQYINLDEIVVLIQLETRPGRRNFEFSQVDHLILIFSRFSFVHWSSATRPTMKFCFGSPDLNRQTSWTMRLSRAAIGADTPADPLRSATP